MKRWILLLVMSALFCCTSSISEEYKVKNFSYLLGKMPELDDSLLRLHFSLYKGYVQNTNAIGKMLEDLRNSNRERGLIYQALERRLSWEMNGMILHELYFENLGPNASLKEKSAFYREIVQAFGSFEKWRENLIAVGMTRGIGWVILFRDPIKRKLYHLWVDNHNINLLAGGKPLLVMDVWEHAYLTAYGLNRLEYIQAFIKNIRWDVVEQRFASSSL